jgi:hypothetical protein
MKPKLIYKWPNVKKEHDEISQIIKETIHTYSVQKKEMDSQLNRDFQLNALNTGNGDDIDMKNKYKSRDEMMHEPRRIKKEA